MLHFFRIALPGLLAMGFLALAANADAVGLMPTPVLNNAQISSDVSFDQGSGKYSYAYTVTNPAGNTGEIWDFTIDISFAAENGMRNQTYGLTIPLGSNQVDFSVVLDKLVSLNATRTIPTSLQAWTIVPFGQVVPPGWNGGLGLDSVAHFASGDNAPNIVPGASLGGFQLISYGVPTIRNVQIMPLWMHIVDDHDTVTDADRIAAGKIEQNIIFHTVSLGPSGVAYGSFAHWNQLRDDLVRAKLLGWITDPTLANTLSSQLAAARQALDAKDFYTAKTLLQPMLTTISQSAPAQRTSEGYALVYLNVQALINNTPNNQIEPKVSLTPKSSLLSIGGKQKLTVTLIDLANGSKPLAGIPIRFKVGSGPNAGAVLGNTQTDLQGIATIAYSSTRTGTDNIIATALFYGGEVTYDDKGSVIWSGGPDLVIPLFSPPLLITKGGNKFYMSEETQNIGNVKAPASVTRYYISAAPIIGATTAQAAQVIGERTIPALQPGKSDSINQKVFHIPGNLLSGTYYLAACADAGNVVVELNENNNCSFSQIEGHQSFIVPIQKIKGTNGKNDEDDELEDEDHHDARDGSKSKEGGIFGNPFGNPEEKR
jgi:hypothetical protein